MPHLPLWGTYYKHQATVQNGNTLYNGEPSPVGGGEDDLLVVLKFFSVSFTGVTGEISNGQVKIYTHTYIPSYIEKASRYIWVSAAGAKEHASSSSLNSSWSDFSLIENCLSDMGVPEAERPFCFDKFFQVVAEAVDNCHKRPILVRVWHITYYTNFPATKSAIEGLKRVRLDRDIIEHTPTCAICLVDFATEDDIDVDHELVITRMPCSHCYHKKCIVHWLHTNHTCPMCRYPMPIDTRIQTSPCVENSS